MGSGREMYAGSGSTVLPARATSSGSSVSGSKRTIAGRTVGSARDRRHRAWRHDDALELGERRGDLADEMILADVEQPVAAVAAGDRHDAAVGEERVRRTPEHPRRIGELGLGRRERIQARPLGEAIQVPPAAAVADEMQLAVGRPLRLGDRLVDPAGRQLGRPE